VSTTPRYKQLLSAAALAFVAGCGAQSNPDGQVAEAQDPPSSAPVAVATATTGAGVAADEVGNRVKIATYDQFPVVHVPAEKGRWENQDLWIESDGQGGLCFGSTHTQSCPIDGRAGFTVDAGIGVWQDDTSGPPPKSQRFIAFASSTFVSVRVSDGVDACQAEARTFSGRPEVSAFDCEVPLDDSIRHFTIEFVSTDGVIWELANGFDSMSATDVLPKG
jgi:hypothetical protein